MRVVEVGWIWLGRDVISYTQPLPTTTADTAMIRKVLLHLLSNAMKFTRPRALAQIEINAQAGSNEVICSVKDNGVGFQPEYGHKLFRMFQCLHYPEESARTEFGPRIVKRSIDKHEGRA